MLVLTYYSTKTYSLLRKGVVHITEKNLTLQNCIWVSIPILFFIGSCFHFLFEFLGKVPIIGAFTPVNESVWEHSKMLLLPIIGWWILFYALKKKKYNIDTGKWFTGMLASLLTSIITMIVVYYFYTQAFGVEILLVDILILFLAILVGQLLGYHVYKFGKGLSLSVSIMISVIIILVFIIWTFNPPELPLFYDKQAGKYGI